MVAALPRRPMAYFHPDPELPKHGVRIRPSGPSAYTVIARDPYGKQRWVKIGSTAEMTIEAARDEARKVIARVKQGLEPFEPPPIKPDSVAAVAGGWLTAPCREKPATHRSPRCGASSPKYVLPHWADREFVYIKRTDVAKLLDHVEDDTWSGHGRQCADGAAFAVNLGA